MFKTPQLFRKRGGTGYEGVIAINNDDDMHQKHIVANESGEESNNNSLSEFPPPDSALLGEALVHTTSTTTSTTTIKNPNDTSDNHQKKKSKQKKKYKQDGESWSVWDILWGSKTPKKATPSRSPSVVTMNRHQTTTSKMGGSSTWVSCMMLCLWDNIFGPRVEHVWHGIESIPLDILNSIGRHALSGELGDNELQIESQPETKMHVFQDYVVVGLLFTAPLDTPALNRLGLLLVVKKEYLHRLLVIYSTIASQMCRLVYKLRALMLRPNKPLFRQTLEVFAPLITPLIQHLEAVFYSFLSPNTFPSSIFCLRRQIFNQDFLTRVITSHLQTHGCTVVLGPNLEVVNMFVDTLSLFLTAKEKERSSLACEGRSYVPDLILQGIVGHKVSEEEIIQSLLPTTIVDLEKQTVMHTQVYHEYIRVRRYYMNLEIEKLIHADLGEDDNEAASPPSSSLKKSSTGKEDAAASTLPNANNKADGVHNNDSHGSAKEQLPPTPNLMRSLREPSPCIAKMIKEAFKLAPGMREGYLTQSMHLLTRKAVLLIKYVEAESKHTKEPMLPVEVIKLIRGVLEVGADADFLVILGIAEKLSPGIYARLDVDPLVMEEKIVELFDQWSLG